MTPSAEPAPRRPLRRLLIATALVATALAAFGAALAGSAPNKPYSAFISAPPSDDLATTVASSSSGGVADVGIRLRNDTRTQGLGSANITAPSGVTLVLGSADLVTPEGGSASAAVVGNVVQLRNLNLPPRGEAFVTFAAVVPCTATTSNNTFTIAVKQSNDFNGTGNDLNLANGPLVLRGIGACVPCPSRGTCTATTSTDLSTATVSATGTFTDERIRASLEAPDAAAFTCEGYDDTTETVEFDLSDAAGDPGDSMKTVKFLIKKPTKPASQYKVCFQTNPDDPEGQILPACTFPSGPRGSSTPTNVPCALAPESRQGKVTLTAIAPPGDPWIKG